jgi:hypothetical protein
LQRSLLLARRSLCLPQALASLWALIAQSTYAYVRCPFFITTSSFVARLAFASSRSSKLIIFAFPSTTNLVAEDICGAYGDEGFYEGAGVLNAGLEDEGGGVTDADGGDRGGGDMLPGMC